MTDLLWFLALALGVLGAMLLCFRAALRGAVPDPHDIEDFY